MPFYLAWIYSDFSRWNFKFFSISELSYGTNQDFMPFIQAQFFVAQYPKELHSADPMMVCYVRKNAKEVNKILSSRHGNINEMVTFFQ